MPPRLLPESPISQVVFAHDYVQLIFQDENLSLYNSVVVRLGAIEYEQGSAGFIDALVSLIGEAVVEVGASEKFALLLNFEHRAQVQVLRTRGVKGPEAFQFNGRHGLLVVEQNE